MGTLSNVRIEPVTVKMQTQQTTQVDFIADVAAALDGKYFKIYSGSGAGFYVWCDIASAADPAPAGFTAIPVVLSSGATAAAIATATAAAILANANFHAKVNPNNTGSIIIMNELYGATTASVDVDTGFTITTLATGSDYDLGYLDGNVELAFEDQLSEITAHQTGTTVLGAIRTGKKIEEMSVTLKEASIANIKEVLKKSATLTTPSAGAATAAWGDSALQFTQVAGVCEKLVLHPVAVSSADRSRDVALWLAYLKPGSIVFSGEEQQNISCTFQFFPDSTKEKSAEFMVYGDHLQNWLR